MEYKIESIEDIAKVTEGKPLLLFDGVCNLCESSVQWIIQRDPKDVFRFASLQSELGEQIIAIAKLKDQYLNTVILVENGKVYTRSTAALRTTKHLKGMWALMQGFLIVPLFLRDAIYELIANNRYRWFGKKEMCWMPSPELKSRFLD